MAMKYFDELKRTMEWLATRPKTIFVGQTAAVPGTFMYQTLRDVPKDRAWELPVNESFQMQFSVGLALAGYVPISVYPRQNFLLLAMGDMSNILDKLPAMSNGQVKPRVIIRVATGPFKPVHPGHQHVGNFAESFRRAFEWIDVVEVNEPQDIFPAYQHALERADGRSTMIIEDGNFYNEK
jgi:pyruvate/2-oxoglutarate/acetoin dehydrogenase E1 component